jgi:hypothetical protein
MEKGLFKKMDVTHQDKRTSLDFVYRMQVVVVGDLDLLRKIGIRRL